MNTFCAVNDGVLIGLIEQAKHRIVYIAPGLYMPVALALCGRFKEIEKLAVTMVLDADEDVCRIGYGELEALKEVHQQSQVAGFYVRSEPGLRVGVLLIDEQTLVWSPTPRTVEAVPEASFQGLSAGGLAANGLFLGSDPNEQIAHAACAEGTDTSPAAAEIGNAAVTPQQVQEVSDALAGNPPIPVDLARITRVFSTKLQFVELKVSRSRVSQQQIRLPSKLFNADARKDLQELLDSRLKVFTEFRDLEIDVPMFKRNGEPVLDEKGQQHLQPVSEAGLESERRQLERDFLYDIAGFGRLVECSRRSEFTSRVEAYKARLKAHALGLNKAMATGPGFVPETVKLIINRMAKANVDLPDHDELCSELRSNIEAIAIGSPKVSLVFKDVTFEQTQSNAFRQKLERALAPHVKRRLGDWFEEFTAARHIKQL